MEKEKDFKVDNKLPDFNGNNAHFSENVQKRNNRVPMMVKDHVVTNDGRVFYPCQFCNRVFPIKKSRTLHIRKCSAKEYILSVDEKADQTANNVSNTRESQPCNIPETKKPPSKIAIQQNIVLNEQMDVSQLLSTRKLPPIKLTIRRSSNNGTEKSNYFTVTSSLILKEKNESNDDFKTITKRLENNSVTIMKETKNEDPDSETIAGETSKTTCPKCTKSLASSLELLRHSRKCHSYPKVLMALSEVQKFYNIKDRSECPICLKPLKTNFRSAFVKHLHTHTKDMKYSCRVCKKKFRRSDHMKAHEKRHVIKKKK